MTIRALLLSLFLLASANVSAERVELPVGATRYQGGLSADGAIAHFLGVPYAAPPVGELRWRSPKPPVTPTGPVDATRFAPACYQGMHIVDWYRGVVRGFGGDPATVIAPEFSEDCLYLNAWTPSLGDSQLRPVMVYVHGGSNKGGWAYEPNYVGEMLARKGVVVVSVAYRLGALGFFSHPDLAESNFALQDLAAALHWVRDNVAALGGDPDNITLFGESAGANNIAHLLVSPLTQGQFQRVILQSGGWIMDARGTRADHLALGQRLEEALAPSGGVEALREVPAAKLLAAAETVYQDHFFDPVVDGQSLLEPAARTFGSGEFASVDMLIGSNANEWLMYLEEGATVEAWLEENLPAVQHRAALSLLQDVETEMGRLDRLQSAQGYVCPSMRLAELIRQRGGRSWLYLFSKVRDGKLAGSMGAYHGAELPYVFDTHDSWLPTSTDDRLLTLRMMDAWVNFAGTGDPGTAELDWPAFTAEQMDSVVLDTAITSGQHRDAELCRLLDSAHGGE